MLRKRRLLGGTSLPGGTILTRTLNLSRKISPNGKGNASQLSHAQNVRGYAMCSSPRGITVNHGK